MTKDNWIKAFESVNGIGTPIFVDLMIANKGDRVSVNKKMNELESFISQLVKDTEKRKDEEWRKKNKFTKEQISSSIIKMMKSFKLDLPVGVPEPEPMSESIIRVYIERVLSDLLKEKESV